MADLDDVPLIFLVEMTDGYSFRNLIDYLKASNTEGNFVFSHKEIRYQQANGGGNLVNYLTIEVCKLAKYEFDSDAPVLVGLQLAELQITTKHIGKKDGIRMYLKAHDPNLYIQLLSSNKSANRSNIYCVRTKEVDYVEYEAFEFMRDESEPNATAIVNDFSKTCKTMNSINYEYVIFQGYERGVKMSAYLQGKLVGHGESFGQCPGMNPTSRPDIRSIVEDTPTGAEDIPASVGPSTEIVSSSGFGGPAVKRGRLIIRPNGGICTIRVGKNTISALSKTTNTSNGGIVKLLLEPKNPARFIFPIGYYGSLTIVILDATANSSTFGSNSASSGGTDMGDDCRH